MVMVCSGKGPQTPFTPELGVRRRCDRRGGKVDSFALAALCQFPLAPLSQNATANAGPRPGGATPTSTKPQCRFRSSGEPRTRGEFFARFGSWSMSYVLAAKGLPPTFNFYPTW
jgi:hypothetical protein